MNNLVFLHGFLGCPSDWDEIRQLISSPPHATALEVSSCSIPDADDWNVGIELLAKEIPKNAILCGYSMGARLALGCAVAGLNELRGLVVVAGSPGIADPERSDRWKHDLQIAEQLLAGDTDEFLRAWYRQPVFASLSDEQIEQLVERRKDVDRARHAKLLRTYSVARQPNFWQPLSKLKIPTLWVAGENDPKYSDLLRRAATASSNSEFHSIKRCGHAIPFEQPAAFAKILNDFICKTERPVHV